MCQVKEHRPAVLKGRDITAGLGGAGLCIWNNHSVEDHPGLGEPCLYGRQLGELETRGSFQEDLQLSRDGDSEGCRK